MRILAPYRSVWTRSLGIAMLFLLAGGSVGSACSTPVFRYAMYNWPAAPYYVFHFHRGGPSQEDQAVNQLLTELSEAEPAAANVTVESIDLAEEGRLDRLPKVVKEAFESYPDGEPSHVIFTPWGVEIFSGKLDEATVRAMADSPARAKLGELLDKGNVAVLLMLPGADDAENAKAEEAAKELISLAAAGSIPVEFLAAAPALEYPSQEKPGDQTGEQEAVPPAQGFDVGFLKVERSDKAEAWLLRTLMKIEPDLPELADEPMIFAVYGRGRALEPYVGKGITVENLTEVVMFLGGACSCMVKDLNPGADLLVRWDWDATAETMAEAEYALQDQLAYQEIAAAGMVDGASPSDPAANPDGMAAPDSPALPAAEPIAVADAGAPATSSDVPANQAEEPAVEAAGQSAPGGATTDAATQPAASPPPAAAPSGGAATTDAVRTPDAPQSFAARQLWTYGIGLVVAVALVLTIGFMLILRRSG